MKRVLLGLLVIGVVGGAIAISVDRPPAKGLQFTLEPRNPVTHTRVNLDDPDEGFQFAIVSDRTGSHRANIFSQAVEKLNLLQPAFVITVGDLIEGGNKKPQEIADEWKEFDGFVNKLNMPFFYAGGNHDLNAKAANKMWQEKLGRTYYHFVYRNVLFLFLNSEDPAAIGSIGKEQIAYVERTLADNRQVRWTIAVVHRPLWISPNLGKNGWLEIESALKDRPYTVFTGHQHYYQKYVRQGRNYYQLATTGGGSLMRGPEHGEFDQIAWVTMKKDGPILANIQIESVLTENLEPPLTNEPVPDKRKPTHPVLGRAFFEGSPIPGAEVLLQPAKGKGARAFGTVAADGSFTLSTYAANDGAVEGDYNVSVIWKQKVGGKLTNLLPAQFANTLTSELRASILAGRNELLLELKKQKAPPAE